MANRPFRFIHASDFHLEQPALGLAEAPAQLVDALIDAPYAAATKVFDAAIAEEAALLILSGDILQSDLTGPRGPLFLLEQFQRLSAAAIPVYWAGGEVDAPESWPSAIPLPPNVHVFPAGRAAEMLVEYEGTPLARVIGLSADGRQPVRCGEFHRDPAGLFTIAVTYGEPDVAAMQARQIDYWALGGRHDRQTVLTSPHIAHYPGSPQGRRFEESGMHGCTLVRVEDAQQAKSSIIPTDAIRWLNERLAIDETTTLADLDARLRERIRVLLESAPRVDLLVAWTIAGSGPLVRQLHRGELSGELLATLREEFAAARPAAWSATLDVESSAAFPAEWYQQPSIRGDFLREVRNIEMNPDGPIDLDGYVAEEHLAGPLAFAPRLPEGAARGRLMREVALLGIELLGEEEVQG